MARVARLAPHLLARKGSATPAMRSGLTESAEDDLGWNDMGHDADTFPATDVTSMGSVVAFPSEPAAGRSLARRPRGASLAAGGKAAFTLRLDAERHLKLRLACAHDARSAQSLLTAALDRLLDDMPDLSQLADQSGRSGRT
ncbi:hypothetical protein H7F51_17150 [Novosphingobium flavum]|uniref:Uncharacterized protein n=1 Tax=Novosphingobium flavum TaxID=1778672 RepID=A0A7X1FUJ0_9SPHN|nr:hypothetical protein [Novosphingobium flavum]